MTMYRVGPAGIPASLKTNMDAVLNKKFGTSTTYAPATWPDNVNLLGPLPEKTASGSVASITDGADGVPLKNWGVTVDATLSGVSSVVCTQAGKNLFDKNATPFQTGKYIISTSVIGSSDFTYTNNANYNVYRIKIEKNTSYVISSVKANAPCWGLMSTSGLVTYVYPNNGGSEGVNITLTTGATDAYLFVSIAVTGTYKCDDVVQIELGATATAYEQYNAETNTVSLGRTIYGGSVDVVKGTGKTKVYKQTYTGDDLSSVSITYGQADEGYTHLYFYIAGIPTAYNPSSLNVISDIGVPWSGYASGSAVPPVGECFNIINTGSGANQRPTVYWYTSQTWANVSAFKTWLNANPITIVYEVADEETFTFTPISPTPDTALGVNNFWADEGDSDVTYRADINMLIASLSGNRGLMMARPQLEEITEETKEDPEVTEK